MYLWTQTRVSRWQSQRLKNHRAKPLSQRRRKMALVPLKLVRDEFDEIVTVKKPFKEFSKADLEFRKRQEAREEEYQIQAYMQRKQREAMLAEMKAGK
jgi:hypothetical protein